MNIEKHTAVVPTNDYVFKKIFGQVGNEEIKKFHTEWKIREKDYRKTILTEVFELHIIELPKLEKFISKNDRKEEKLILWAKFLLNPDSMEEEEMKENKDIKKAKEELDKMRQDEYEERIAELMEKKIMDDKAREAYVYEEGFDKGVEQGVERGEKNAIIKIAKTMLESGEKIENIVKITGLTKEEIQKI